MREREQLSRCTFLEKKPALLRKEKELVFEFKSIFSTSTPLVSPLVFLEFPQLVNSQLPF